MAHDCIPLLHYRYSNIQIAIRKASSLINNIIVGKSRSKFGGKNLFVTPTKKMLSATPRPALGNKTNLITPSQQQAFKKPKFSESIKKLPCKTRIDLSSAFTPLKNFKIYEDAEDTVTETKSKISEIDAPEKCPWSLKEEVPDETTPPPIDLCSDFVFAEPKPRPRLNLAKLGNLQFHDCIY